MKNYEQCLRWAHHECIDKDGSLMGTISRTADGLYTIALLIDGDLTDQDDVFRTPHWAKVEVVDFLVLEYGKDLIRLTPRQQSLHRCLADGTPHYEAARKLARKVPHCLQWGGQMKRETQEIDVLQLGAAETVYTGPYACEDCQLVPKLKPSDNFRIYHSADRTIVEHKVMPWVTGAVEESLFYEAAWEGNCAVPKPPEGIPKAVWIEATRQWLKKHRSNDPKKDPYRTHRINEAYHIASGRPTLKDV